MQVFLYEIEHMDNCIQAYRVRSCIPLLGEKAACAKALFAPLTRIDDCLLLVKNGRIAFIGKYSPKILPAGLTTLTDLGDNVLVPCAFNAHTHVQLSHLLGKTLWGKGFVPWLQSLIPLLSLPFDAIAINNAMQSMKNAGTSFFADYTNTGLSMVAQSAEDHALQACYFAEWFGFFENWDENLIFPERVRKVMEAQPNFYTQHKEEIVPCAHALYSTAPDILQGVKAWCKKQNKPFSLHLAEFAEEVDALTLGKGALVDLYTEKVLPKNWKAPGFAPVQYAQKLGLLDTDTLAVHCVMCEDAEIDILSKAKVTVCLCPRSNALLGVGTAPFWKLAKTSLYLCLGTDGLSSNKDLNVWNEALYLREKFDFPWEALLRMLTVNAAAVFRQDRKSIHCSVPLGTLEVGSLAQWTFLP